MDQHKYNDEQLDLLLDIIRMYRAKGLSPEDCKQKLRSSFPTDLIEEGVQILIDAENPEESISLRSSNDFYGWYEGPNDSMESHWGRLKAL